MPTGLFRCDTEPAILLRHALSARELGKAPATRAPLVCVSTSSHVELTFGRGSCREIP